MHVRYLDNCIAKQQGRMEAADFRNRVHRSIDVNFVELFFANDSEGLTDISLKKEEEDQQDKKEKHSYRQFTKACR